MQHMDVRGLGPDTLLSSPVGAVRLLAVYRRHPAILPAAGEQHYAGIGFDRDIFAEDIHLVHDPGGVTLQIRVGAERPAAQAYRYQALVLKHDILTLHAR